MNWAIAADNTVVVARFFVLFCVKNQKSRQKAQMTNGRKMVVFLRDSILDKVELRKGNRKMNNKNMGVIKWADFFGLKRKKRMEKKKCGQCCLMCPYYRECRNDGEL